MNKILLGILIPLFSFSQTINKEKLDVLVQDYGQISLFTGIVQISQHGKILYENAYGYANRASKKTFNSNTRFNIASGGKSFTATLIMQLVERGKIDLHKPIQNYIPDHAVPNADKITIHHLLTHTSGLSDYMLTPGYFDKKIICKNLDEVMELVIKMPLDFSTPGIRYRYSNSGYIVLGKILEYMYKKTYGQILNEQILKPLAIKDLSLDYPANYGEDNIAKPYYIISSTRALEGIESELPPFSDGGFIVSSTSLNKFFEGLYSGKLVSKATLQVMAQHNLIKDDKLSYYGFVSKSLAGIEGSNMGLTGGGAGFTTYVEMNTANGVVIAVCANNRFKSELMVDAIRKLLYQNTYQKPNQWVVPWLIDKMEIKEALIPDLRRYVLNNYGRDFSDPRYFIEAADLMQLGGMPEESEKLLLAVTKAYDNHSNAYSALGTFYLRQGNKEYARKNFEKSLGIDPSNAFAKNGMAQLLAFDNQTIDKLYAQFREGFQKLDTAIMSSIYWEDAQYLAFDTEIQNGKNVFIKGFSVFFNEIINAKESIDINFQLEKRQFSADGSMCVDVGYFEFVRNGEKINKGVGKMVNVFAKKENEWRFLVDMSSNAPSKVFIGGNALLKNFKTQ
jgi:CubicO group peptidase (beta-lactamase class C family)/ketosteroid isomerase-like protein